MAKRGKAATRQARQRRAQSRPGSVRPTSTPTVTERVEASTPPPVASSANRVERVMSTSVSSALSARAREEYHYVTRDLRNIGILAGVMLAVLAVAFVVFRSLGIGPG